MFILPPSKEMNAGWSNIIILERDYMYANNVYSFSEIVDIFGCVETVEDVFKIKFATNVGSKYEEYLSEDELASWDGGVDETKFIASNGKAFSGSHLFRLKYKTNCKECRGHRYLQPCCIKSATVVKE